METNLEPVEETLTHYLVYCTWPNVFFPSQEPYGKGLIIKTFGERVDLTPIMAPLTIGGSSFEKVTLVLLSIGLAILSARADTFNPEIG